MIPPLAPSARHGRIISALRYAAPSIASRLALSRPRMDRRLSPRLKSLLASPQMLSISARTSARSFSHVLALPPPLSFFLSSLPTSGTSASDPDIAASCTAPLVALSLGAVSVTAPGFWAKSHAAVAWSRGGALCGVPWSAPSGTRASRCRHGLY